jgi:hypothetical protein
MNQLKRRNGVSHDRAFVAPGVWDSVVGHWGSRDHKMVVSIPNNTWRDYAAQLSRQHQLYAYLILHML